MAPDRRPRPTNKLQQLFPNTNLPVIISAPMLGVSNGALAAQVSSAGGLGTIPGGYDFEPGSAHLRALAADLEAARAGLGLSDLTLTPAPVAVGFLTCHPSVARFRETALPLLERYLPQAVWLFAPDPDAGTGDGDGQGDGRAHPDVIEALHDRGFKVFVQVGTVAAAREAVVDGADVVVAQGADAGGHQFAAASGVISLVPEVRAMLDGEFPGRDVALVAAGGIADPGAVVAAIALGADGVVMGTKFIVAKESSAPEYRRKAILKGKDGGRTTVKSSFHDDLLGSNSVWPKMYDGRAIITESYRDHTAGVSLEENRARFGAARDAGDDSREVTWAGTGVGLVNDAIPAGDIVRNTQIAARQRLQTLRTAFDDEGKDSTDKSWIKEIGHTLYKHK